MPTWQCFRSTERCTQLCTFCSILVDVSSDPTRRARVHVQMPGGRGDHRRKEACAHEGPNH